MAPDPLEVAADRLALSAILDAQGHHREAQDTLREVLATLERVLGENHYEVAVALDRLSAAVRRAGDPMQAEVLHARAVEIQRRVLGGHRIDRGTERARPAPRTD